MAHLCHVVWNNRYRAYEIYKNAILELEEITKKELGTNLVKVLKQIN